MHTQTLKEVITQASHRKIAVGHFNVSELATLKAVFESARALGTPVIIGVSEGERDFIGAPQAVALVKSLREEYGFPVFINADHTHSLQRVKEAVAAGFDAILFDGGKLSLAQNIAQTKEAVAQVKQKSPHTLVEGELGYIGNGSEILKEIPRGAAVTERDITSVEDARRFVRETGVDMLAPAVGNIHGMLAGASNPHLFIERIREIKEAVKIPLVLHGGSGTPEGDFTKAIQAGMSIIHISTELRAAWRAGMEKGLAQNKDEVAPYKLMGQALDEVQRVVYHRLRLFNA